jgi:hypothetical protein
VLYFVLHILYCFLFSCYLPAFFWHKCCVLLPNVILCLNYYFWTLSRRKWHTLGALQNLIQMHKTWAIQFEILNFHLLSSFLLSFSPFKLFITLLYKYQYTLHFKKFTTPETNIASKLPVWIYKFIISWSHH